MGEQRFPCPCCGFFTLHEATRGSYELCPVCDWEDDGVQFSDPEYEGGANSESLNQARANFRTLGASSPAAILRVRPPLDEERPVSTKYIRVGWKHQRADLPVILYSELDDNRFEVRKVEVFHDGRCEYASREGSSGQTRLGIVAVPDLCEIAKDPQFEPVEIAPSDFEAAWRRREAR